MGIVGSISPLGMQTLLSIGIFERLGTTYCLTQHQGKNAQELGPSRDIETEFDLESESAPEPEPEPRVSRPSLEASFEKFRTEVCQQWKVLERVQRELAAS